MSTEQLRRFLEWLASDEEALRAVKAMSDPLQVIAFAKSNGYDFDMEELTQYMDRRGAANE
jgi:predicted ribosomally synthesized peptide with nif11-like leader